MTEIKIKPLTKEQIIISIDRLTRFKHPEIKYLRVFKDIILSNLIIPKFKKSELDKMDYATLRDYAQNIINSSLKTTENDYGINKKIYNYEKSIFFLNDETLKLLNNQINYKGCLNFIENTDKKNLAWLKELNEINDIIKSRQEKALHYPVEKIIIAEGATEETLLPEFAKLCGYDFDKNGIHLIAAGGKNQVVRVFYEMSQSLKIPIFVLLDKDGTENSKEIQPKLRSQDKIHIINCGEFEDLLPEDLIKRTINYGLKDISIIEEQELKETTSRVKFLKEVFKTRGMHEFKKVEFAQMVKTNITSSSDVSTEIKNIIEEIKKL